MVNPMKLFKPEKKLMNHSIHFGENPLVGTVLNFV